MVKCNYIGHDEKEFLQTVIGEKYQPGKGRLLGVYDSVAERYDTYLNDFDTIGAITNSPFSGADQRLIKEALESCYDSETKPFAAIRGQIFTSQPEPILTLCPYCLLNWPKTLDHYIGKSAFPEFSILCKNLIPCCWDCNNEKDENWRENGQRRFIHFYNDSFLDQRFLKARLIYPPGGDVPKIEYYLEQPPAMPAAAFQIVQWHFEDLKLLSRYNQRAGPTFSAEYGAAKELNLDHTPPEKIRHILLKRHEKHSAKVCLNYYQAIIYETLANDLTFLASLVP
jgi:hypothetical protein